MFKTLRYVFLTLLAIVLLAVASANRDLVTLQLLPDEMDAFLGIGWSIELPLFLVIFAGILAGLAIGFVWEWFREAKIRAQGNVHRQRATQLEREITRLQGSKAEDQDDILALLDGTGAKG